MQQRQHHSGDLVSLTYSYTQAGCAQVQICPTLAIAGIPADGNPFYHACNVIIEVVKTRHLLVH
jgi:hypothetical protein